VADPLNRIIPSASVDRTIAVDRERDKDRERGAGREKLKHAERQQTPESPAAEEPDDQQPAEPEKGHGLDIKV
jgi:hypothetical protein